MSKRRGFTKFSVFLKRVSLLNPRLRTNFVAFPLENDQERASKFGSILGPDRDLVNNCSAAARRAPNWTGRALKSSYSVPWVPRIGPALKGTNLRGQTPICGFLRVPAVFCGFLRKSAVFCENLRFPNASFSRTRRESAKISENLRFGSVRPLRFVPLGAA